MFGIKLKIKNKIGVDPVVGELQFTLDTDELATISNNEIVFRKNSQILERYAIAKTDGVPSGGIDGDWSIDETSLSSEFKEYFKVGSWQERPEGYTESQLLTNFASKVDWSGFLTRDGSVKFNQEDYDAKVLTPESLVVKKIADTAILEAKNGVKTDGTITMEPTYEPNLDGDVLDVKSLKSGNLYFYPPTIKPEVLGAVWNDGGVPRIVNKVQVWERRSDTFASTSDANLGQEMSVIDDKVLVSSPWSTNSLETNVHLLNSLTGETLVSIPTPTYTVKVGSTTYFGSSVALDDTRIFVACSSTLATMSGIFIFDHSGTQLDFIPNPMGISDFGYGTFASQIDVSGETLVVGSADEHVSGFDRVGAFYIFDLTDNSFTRIARPDPFFRAYFGSFDDISIHGNKILVPDDLYSSSDVVNGRVRLYDLLGTELGAIAPYANDPLNEFPSADFGTSVVVTDNYIAIGDSEKGFNSASTASDGNWNDGGAVSLYDSNGVFIRELRPSGSEAYDYSWFGTDIAIDETADRIFVGSTGEQNDLDIDPTSSYANAGQIYVFELSTGVLLNKFSSENPLANERFSYTIGIDKKNRHIISFSFGDNLVSRIRCFKY